MCQVTNHRNHLPMLRPFVQYSMHLAFLLVRPLTIGVRGICYNPHTNGILLVKHNYTEEWALPGGGIEVGESMTNALQRELKEEAGLTWKFFQVLDVYHNNSVSRRDHVIICLLENWREDPAHKLPNLEIATKVWFSLDKLPAELTPCTKYAIVQLSKTILSR